ncbi:MULTISPECIES: hypothetical protein [Kaistia]|uniref:Uncharacterized protein n=1 Tax=Kaistia nematophila TaxID=2994654 RepID=A0A9X3E0E4_9HYPH|nr:hypothetical protein [Kaistia nematophila]MBN9026221.1 hypothetical protein [Hyphomicrobiales bacterium]MBN9058922.1 hypothetical protein [Hyphomicrobiales bacterium]MCX5568994.1 hypothetical protein [Kaistia nematophila]
MDQTPIGSLADFRATLGNAAPPSALSGPLQALWHLEKGEWDAAHALVQDDESRAGAWVHAHVHRIEGDLWNARYWYGRAGRAAGEGDVALEREAIVVALLRD